MFKVINIHDELLKEKTSSEESLLNNAISILKNDELLEEKILSRINASGFDKTHADIPYSALSDEKNIFTIGQIKSVCIKYRLRFLDSSLFKGTIPYDAISKVKELEKKHKIKFSDFKILAPSEVFKLEDRNKDPLLFALVSSNGEGQEGSQYLLIHKWGNDINCFRKILSFPLSTVKRFIFTILVLSLIIALAVPTAYPTRMFIFLLSNLFFFAVYTSIGYLRFNQDFSENEWNSKYIS